MVCGWRQRVRCYLLAKYHDGVVGRGIVEYLRVVKAKRTFCIGPQGIYLNLKFVGIGPLVVAFQKSNVFSLASSHSRH